MTDTTALQEPQRIIRFRWIRAAIAILFGLLFAFYLYEAISQTLQLSDYIAAQNPRLHKLGHAELQFPWIAIAPLLLLPVITYVLGFVIGRKRPVIFTVAIFVMALAALSAGSLSLESVASQLTRIT